MLTRLRDAVEAVANAPGWRGRGSVVSVNGPVVRARLPGARVGDGCVFELDQAVRFGEVVGFVEGDARLLVLGDAVGIGPGVQVLVAGRPTVRVGAGLLGRVVDATTRPIDDAGPLDPGTLVLSPLERPAPHPLSRPPIDEPLCTGVRSIDGLLALGHGQRVGLFAGPGVGKSSLMGEIAAQADVDVVVVALVGERGREVREVLDGPLRAARARSVVVVATSDEPALMRARAALAATTIAEWFRDEGQRVLLLVDSLTRYARALREVGLAAGEGVARDGFPTSVFAALPRLLERAGPASVGSISAIYTVLQETESGTDAVSDEVRGLLDGHIVLTRALAERGHWPAVDVPASISRLAGAVTDEAHRSAAARISAAIAAYEERRELVVLGAWEPGQDPAADRAVEAWPQIESFLRQPLGAPSDLADTRSEMIRLAESL